MTKNEISISRRSCFLYQDEAATHLLIQPIDEHDLEGLDQEVETIKELSDKPFSLVAFMIKDWNQELTPWAAPPVFGRILTSYLAAIHLQDCLPYGQGIRQTSLKPLLLPPHLYGTLSGLIMHQRTDHLQSPSISVLAIRRRKQRILLWRRLVMPSESSMSC